MLDAVARFLSSLLQYAVLAASVIAALGTVGVQTTSLVAVLGSVALVIGLALQGSLSNFAAGEARLAIYAALEGAGIEIPFPQVVLHRAS